MGDFRLQNFAFRTGGVRKVVLKLVLPGGAPGGRSRGALPGGAPGGRSRGGAPEGFPPPKINDEFKLTVGGECLQRRPPSHISYNGLRLTRPEKDPKLFNPFSGQSGRPLPSLVPKLVQTC